MGDGGGHSRGGPSPSPLKGSSRFGVFNIFQRLQAVSTPTSAITCDYILIFSASFELYIFISGTFQIFVNCFSKHVVRLLFANSAEYCQRSWNFKYNFFHKFINISRFFRSLRIVDLDKRATWINAGRRGSMQSIRDQGRLALDQERCGQIQVDPMQEHTVGVEGSQHTVQGVLQTMIRCDIFMYIFA